MRRERTVFPSGFLAPPRFTAHTMLQHGFFSMAERPRIQEDKNSQQPASTTAAENISNTLCPSIMPNDQPRRSMSEYLTLEISVSDSRGRNTSRRGTYCFLFMQFNPPLKTLPLTVDVPGGRQSTYLGIHPSMTIYLPDSVPT